MKRITVLVYRQNKFTVEQPTVISCQKTRRIPNSSTLLSRLTKALTKWMIETQVGKGAWEYSADDFDTGELCRYFGAYDMLRGNSNGPDSSLVPYLEEVGILDLNIEQPDICDYWEYHTVLIDAEKVRVVHDPDPDEPGNQR